MREMIGTWDMVVAGTRLGVDPDNPTEVRNLADCLATGGWTLVDAVVTAQVMDTYMDTTGVVRKCYLRTLWGTTSPGADGLTADQLRTSLLAGGGHA